MDTPNRTERVIFTGRRIELRAVELAVPHGQRVQRELVVHPGAAVILPFLPDGRIVMTRNTRFAVKDELWELPAGTLEPPEPPEACAARELIEETGYRAGQLRPLGRFYSSPGFCNELLHAFVASELEEVGQQLDAGEQIRVAPLEEAEVRRMARDGRIVDGKTLATLCLYWLTQEARP